MACSGDTSEVGPVDIKPRAAFSLDEPVAIVINRNSRLGPLPGRWDRLQRRPPIGVRAVLRQSFSPQNAVRLC